MARRPEEVGVDIVVNNYNYGRYLGAALDSALAQTHPKLRVIAVDDGSGDDSREILAGYEDRVTVVLKENGGQASALNAGLELCDGEVVVFLDADDVLRPEFAARAAAVFAASEAVAKVQLRMDVIDAEGRPTGDLKPPPRLPMPNGDLRRIELAYPFDMAWLPTTANAFRRDSLGLILPIPENEYRIGADWYLLHLATLLGEVVSVAEVSCSYRVHGSNNYEPADAELSLDNLRQTIGFARSTAAALLALAGRLGLPHPREILSVADLGNRLVSLRLDPARHPRPEDTRRGILVDAITALRRRTNASALLRAAFAAWFVATAIAPRPLAERLGIWFLFPARRRRISGLLGRGQRS